jgi:hypothetical protein
MRRVREHLIPHVSGVSRDKPSRRGCEERETISTADNNAGAPCLTAVVTRASLSMELDTMKFRIVLNIALVIAAHLAACLIVATYKATRYKMRKLKMRIKHLRGRIESKFNRISRIYVAC